jgi:hypothetical protein
VVAEAARSNAVADPLIDVAVSVVAEQTQGPEEPIREAIEAAWSTAEAEHLRQELASSIVALATAERGEDRSIDLTDAIGPLLRSVVEELGDAGLPVSEPQIDQFIDNMGPTIVEIDVQAVPVVAPLAVARDVFSRVVSVGWLAAAVFALLAYAVAVERSRRLRRMALTVAICSFGVAGLMWVVAYFAEGALPDEGIGRAFSSVIGTNLVPIVLIGVVTLAVGIGIRPRTTVDQVVLPSAPVDPHDDPWWAPPVSDPLESATH